MCLRNALTLSALTAALMLVAALAPAAAQTLSLPDAEVFIPGDDTFTLANETGAPVSLDSLAMRFEGAGGIPVHSWGLWTADGDEPDFDCGFLGPDPWGSGCWAPAGFPLTFAVGAVVRVYAGHDGCAFCRQGETPKAGRFGTETDTLLVYSGGSAVPIRALFYSPGFVSLGEAPADAGPVLSVGPNPVERGASVSLARIEPFASVRVSVYDALGRRVAVLHDGPLAAGAASFALDTSGWAAGAYVVRARVGGVTATARLTVAR